MAFRVRAKYLIFHHGGVDRYICTGTSQYICIKVCIKLCIYVCAYMYMSV